jgi:hypothetical protein
MSGMGVVGCPRHDRWTKGRAAVGVVNIGSAVLHLALFGGGVVVALMLRGRDQRAALLTALGFGCELLGIVVGVGQRLVASGIVSAASSVAQVQTVFLVFGAVIMLIELAGAVLIFLGLLRVVRRRRPVAPWMEAGR